MNPQPNQQPAHSPTPGPWIATEWDDVRDGSHGFDIGGHPDHNAGLSVAVCSGPDCKTNAAYIVKACNSHQALVDALQSTERVADELMKRASEIDRRLIALDGRKPDCELGEIVRLREQLIENREALRSATQ